MTSLEEKAEEGQTQFVAASDLLPGSMWCIESSDLVPAGELGTEEFPQHGEWLPASQGTKVDYFLECPSGLAMAIMEQVEARGAESPEGYWFRVLEAERDREDDDNAPWVFDVKLAAADVDSREEAIESLGDV